MEKLADLIVKALEEKFEGLQSIRIKRQKRIMAAYSEANSKIFPNVDSAGRYHAPCDGYEDIDGRGVYGKGEFLPIPEIVFEQLEMEGIHVDRYSKKFGNEARVLLDTYEGLELKEKLWHLYGLDCSFGKKFERDGAEFSYMYIRGNEAMVKVISDVVSEVKENEKEARKLLKGDAPEGKLFLSAKIVFIKRFIPLNSWDAGKDKMMVEFENKSTAWGTLPKCISGEDVGFIFNLSATFKRTENDNTHSFFSRPIVN